MRIGFLKADKLQGGLYASKVIEEHYVASHKYFSGPNGSIGLNKQTVRIHGCRACVGSM